MITPPRPPDDQSQPPLIRLAIESGPRGCLLTALLVAALVALAILATAGLLHLAA